MLISVFLGQHCGLLALNKPLKLLSCKWRSGSSKPFLHSRALDNLVIPFLEMRPLVQIQVKRVRTLKDPRERHNVGDGVLVTGEIGGLLEAVLEDTEEVLDLVQELLNAVVGPHGGESCEGKCLACPLKSALVAC